MQRNESRAAASSSSFSPLYAKSRPATAPFPSHPHSHPLDPTGENPIRNLRPSTTTSTIHAAGCLHPSHACCPRSHVSAPSIAPPPPPQKKSLSTRSGCVPVGGATSPRDLISCAHSQPSLAERALDLPKGANRAPIDGRAAAAAAAATVRWRTSLESVWRARALHKQQLRMQHEQPASPRAAAALFEQLLRAPPHPALLHNDLSPRPRTDADDRLLSAVAARTHRPAWQPTDWRPETREVPGQDLLPNGMQMVRFRELVGRQTVGGQPPQGRAAGGSWLTARGASAPRSPRLSHSHEPQSVPLMPPRPHLCQNL
jgi:hypothetical protein